MGVVLEQVSRFNEGYVMKGYFLLAAVLTLFPLDLWTDLSLFFSSCPSRYLTAGLYSASA